MSGHTERASPRAPASSPDAQPGPAGQPSLANSPSAPARSQSVIGLLQVIPERPVVIAQQRHFVASIAPRTDRGRGRVEDAAVSERAIVVAIATVLVAIRRGTPPVPPRALETELPNQRVRLTADGPPDCGEAAERRLTARGNLSEYRGAALSRRPALPQRFRPLRGVRPEGQDRSR